MTFIVNTGVYICILNDSNAERSSILAVSRSYVRHVS